MHGGGESCVERRLLKDALNLITKQEQEIEELKAENAKLTEIVNSKVYDFVQDVIDNGKARAEMEKQAAYDFAKRIIDTSMCMSTYDDGTMILTTSDKQIYKLIEED